MTGPTIHRRARRRRFLNGLRGLPNFPFSFSPPIPSPTFISELAVSLRPIILELRLMMDCKTRSPRCLMFYPWNLDEPSGALSLFLSYSRALKSAGYRLDCYAPRGAAGGHGIFDNVFVMPDRESPVIQHLESLGRLCEDSSLPEKLGRDEASMAAAGVLAAISDYDVVGIQYTRCHSLRHMLPPGLPVVVFTHDLDALVRRQEEMIFGTPSGYQLEDEASRLKPFSLVTVVGPDDAQALKSVEPSMPIVEAPFTLPIAERVVVREHSP